MKTIIKITKWLLLSLVTLTLGIVIFVYAMAERTYEAPYPNITATDDPQVLSRGKHLFYGAAHCAGCHAPRSEVARLQRGEEVLPSGGEDFALPLGMVYAPNITPDHATGIGALTDGELARTLRFGVKSNGMALIDFMPFYDLSDNDLTALISFLRSLPPVQNERPENDWNFFGKAMFAFGMFKPMGDAIVPLAPPEGATAEYGRYLAESIANCKGCHTKRSMVTGQFTGEEYAGQMTFGVLDENSVVDNNRYIVTPNLTPDSESGRMSQWTLEMFIERFRIGRVIPESIMPWGQYSRMTDQELTALYLFLQSLPPVRVEPPIPVGVQTGPASG